jgi:hypothetical protein
MSHYRAVHPSYAAVFGGDVFEAEYSAVEERDWLDRGLLELVPRRYKVTGPHAVRGVEPGETFLAGLRVDEESALIAGGHIARVGGPLPEPDPEPKPTKRAAKPKPTKE